MAQLIKNLPAGDLCSIPGLGRSPGERKDYPLQYSGLEDSIDCIDIVHGVAKSRTRLSNSHFHFHGIARRDKKAFLSDQCKEIEENNRMGKNRDLFKKIRDTKGQFHAKIGTIKDRNCMGLTQQKILRRGGKNTWKNYAKKILMTQITTIV